MKRRVFLLMFGGVLLSCLTAPRERFFINETPSMPRGVYWVSELDSLQRGESVLISFPEKLREFAATHRWLSPEKPLLKTVGALAGDTVCNDSGALTINGVIQGPIFGEDSEGRALPHIEGCIVIAPGTFLPLSRTSERSFDGRYFGPLSTQLISGRARLLFSF